MVFNNIGLVLTDCCNARGAIMLVVVRLLERAVPTPL